MATLKEVAKLAGVSISTASRALNGNERISEDTAKAVKNAAAKLRYSPNIFAQNLVKQKSRVVALIVPDLSNPFFSTLVNGVLDAAITQNYSILLYNTDNDENIENNAMEMVLAQSVEGIIITPQGNGSNVFPTIKREKTPLVFLDRKPDIGENDINSIILDNYQGGIMATRFLLEKNLESITLITGPQDASSADARAKGYLKAIDGYAIAPCIYHVPFTYRAGLQIGLQILSSGNCDVPRAIIAGNDLQAIGIMHAAAQLGVKIPEELEIVSFDDTILASTVIPALTSISQPTYRMGAMAMNMLLDIFNGKRKEKGNHEVLEPGIVVRASTGQSKNHKK